MQLGALILAGLTGSTDATQGLVVSNHNFESEDFAKPGRGFWVSILLAYASLTLMRDLVGIWRALPGTQRALQDRGTQTDDVLYEPLVGSGQLFVAAGGVRYHTRSDCPA